MKTYLFYLILVSTTLFSFTKPPVKAPFMMVFVEPFSPSSGKADGKIQVSVSGGTAPYQILVVSVPLAETKIFSNEEKMEANGLKGGKYEIHIHDSKDLSYFREVIL